MKEIVAVKRVNDISDDLCEVIELAGGKSMMILLSSNPTSAISYLHGKEAPLT